MREAKKNKTEVPGAPAAVQPEAVQPEAVQPEAVQPGAAQPEAVQPEVVQTETAQSEAVQPEAAQTAAAQTEAAQTEAAQMAKARRASLKSNRPTGPGAPVESRKAQAEQGVPEIREAQAEQGVPEIKEAQAEQGASESKVSKGKQGPKSWRRGGRGSGKGEGLRSLKSLSFKSRIFFACMLVALIPMLLMGGLLMGVFKTSLAYHMYQEGSNRLGKMGQTLESLFQQCTLAAEHLAASSDAAEVMLDNKSLEEQQAVYLKLYRLAKEFDQNAEFSLYDAGGRLRYAIDNLPQSVYLPKDWGLLKKAAGQPGRLSFYTVDRALDFAPGRIALQAACELSNRTGVCTGYLVLGFSEERLRELLSRFLSPGDRLTLLDAQGRQVLHMGADYPKGASAHDKGAGKRLWLPFMSGQFYLSYEQEEAVSQLAYSLMWTVIFGMLVFSVLVGAAVSGVLTAHFAKPIERLDRAMMRVSLGDLSARVETDRADELGRLSANFNLMTEELKQYMEETLQKEKTLNETRLKLFQTQLNPHFLYNTLDTIKWSAKIKEQNDIALMSEKLAFILRKSISAQTMHSLREELETIKSYVCIQRIRFLEALLYETEIPEGLENCLIPKMILQPLVENAIISGFAGRTHGYICIFAYRKCGTLFITVTDDGQGMPEDILNWANGAAPQPREGHFGLYNVIRILRLNYGDAGGIRLSSSEEGTSVTLSLPEQYER